MKFIEYVKDNIINIIIYMLTLILLLFMLTALKISIYINIIIFVVFMFSGSMILIFSFLRKYNFYKLFNANLERLDKKYLILETIPDPITYEERIMVDSLYEINKSMIENIRENKAITDDFKEFVEMWIHEVKIPISSMVLKCHNENDKSFLRLINRLDNSIDTILYYVRLGDTEKDFSISEVNLRELIRSVGMKNKDDLLLNNITFEVNLQALVVSSDKKWLEFIVNQIINNSIKYKKDNDSIIKISSREESDKNVLEIYDNGIGILKKDIRRVFDKSFTGMNGRNRVKSTGMGLYIIKKLCERLGHNIYIESEVNEWTKVVIEFGKNDIYKL